MSLMVSRESVRRILRSTERLLLAGAALVLVYCAFVLIDACTFQNREDRRLERLLADPQAATLSAKVPPAISDGLIGRIVIPRLGISVIAVEGVDELTLRRGVGHIPGTALPGQPGNIGISGHRDTYFRPLRNIRQNDIVTLTTLQGEYSYRVVSTRMVGPHNIAVLDPSGSQILTLVTCYPFYFVGPAPARFIVRAERVGKIS